MNTILTILLLIALAVHVVGLWMFFRSVEGSKEKICKAIERAEHDWYYHDNAFHLKFIDYLRENFDKYL